MEDFMKAVNIEPLVPEGWSFELFKKMCNKPYKERLVIAGALIAAEIDRLNAIERNLKKET